MVLIQHCSAAQTNRRIPPRLVLKIDYPKFCFWLSSYWNFRGFWLYTYNGDCRKLDNEKVRRLSVYDGLLLLPVDGTISSLVDDISADTNVGRWEPAGILWYRVEIGVRTGTSTVVISAISETTDTWCSNLQVSQWVPSTSVILHSQFVVGCPSSLCNVLVIISVWRELQSLTLDRVENDPSRSSKNWGKWWLTMWWVRIEAIPIKKIVRYWSNYRRWSYR